MSFPYGKAPFLILLVAIASGLGVWWTQGRYGASRPDLILATHARLHADVYRTLIPAFEKRYGVRVDVQEVEFNAMKYRLQAAFLAGSEVPDLVEIPENLSAFSRGPLRDIGFSDLTDWVDRERLRDRMVASRFSLWSTRGRIFALPHDVHPVMLAYRADIVEGELGIDVSQIRTWDDFVAAAHRARLRSPAGRHALELPSGGIYYTLLLLLQHGGGLFDRDGNVIFDREAAADVIVWYVRQLWGPDAIAYDPGSVNGEGLWRTLTDGGILFYFAPDWRTRAIEQYAPGASGKMKLMPLPAWSPGGLRTSTWGATGIAITRRSPHQELARRLIQYLYLSNTDGGASALDLHILPAVKADWSDPAFDRPDPYFSGEPIMRLYSRLAPDVPPVWSTPYSAAAERKLEQSLVDASIYYRDHGEAGLRDFVRSDLKRNADYIRSLIARNVLDRQ